MNGYEPSKENPPAPAPGYPPTYETGPKPVTIPAPDYSAPANTMYYPPTGPQYAGNYPPYNAGYPPGQNVMLAPVRVYEKDYLGYSIFTCLCCCLPLGIAALIYSSNTRDANKRGDADRAHTNSRTAFTLNNVALGLGLAVTIAWVAYVIYVNVVVWRSVNSDYNYNYQG